MKKADYKFHGEIYTDKISVKRVLCEVYLPKRRNGKIEVKLYLTDEQAGKLDDLFEFSLKGEIKGFSSEVEAAITADKMYRLTKGQLHWSPTLIDETILVCKPFDLKVTRLFPHDREEAINDKIIFWISHSNFLSPLELRELSYTGKVNLKTSNQVKVILENNIPLTFRNNYNDYINSDGENVTYKELVAETTSRKTLFDENQIGGDIIKCLDDFLTLVSFAERRRLICIGWDFYNTNSHSSFYRRNVAIPEPEKDLSDSKSLIEGFDVHDFIRKTYKTFSKIDQRDLIRQAMQCVVASLEAPIESSFQTLFAALETLMKSFKINRDFETILPTKEWENFASDLKIWIGQHKLLTGDKSDKKKDMIFGKIRELNRCSFSHVFKSLCKDYKIDLRDLWPMIGNSNDRSSLAGIRNRLVHGEYFNLVQLHSMFVASEHLRWVVERILLSFLDWPTSHSHVNRDYLAKILIFNKNWENHKKILC